MTTASLHREMVEALRAAKRAIDDLAGQACCGPGCVDDEAMDAASECRAIARAALEGWEKRERLRHQEKLVLLVCGSMLHDNPFERRRMALDLLDALEVQLYGQRG